MPGFDVEISGPSEDAKVSVDGSAVPLTRAGNKYTGYAQLSAGKHVYAVTVFGMSGEKWKAKVVTNKATNNHQGHMSPAGFDTSGDTEIKV